MQDQLYGGLLGTPRFRTEDAIHDKLTERGGEFRSKLDVRDAGMEQLSRVSIDGTLNMEYPLAMSGQLFNLRLERMNWLVNLDYKQIFNDTPDKVTGYVHIDGVKTEIAKNVQDIKSLVYYHNLGTVIGVDGSLDYIIEIRWSKTVDFSGNYPEIEQWLKAIGLESTTYTKNTKTQINSQDILIGQDAVLDLVMERNDVNFQIFGDKSNQLVLAQFIATKPIHEIIAYNATDESTYFRTVLLGSNFRFKIYHHWLNKPLNKLTLDQSIIDIEVRGKILK